MKNTVILEGSQLPYTARDNKKKYEHYRSFHRKDTIITYIQAGVALTVLAIVCTGLYFNR